MAVNEGNQGTLHQRLPSTLQGFLSYTLPTRAAEVVAALQPGCEEMRMRKWRKNEEMERE